MDLALIAMNYSVTKMHQQFTAYEVLAGPAVAIPQGEMICIPIRPKFFNASRRGFLVSRSRRRNSNVSIAATWFVFVWDRYTRVASSWSSLQYI